MHTKSDRKLTRLLVAGGLGLSLSVTGLVQALALDGLEDAPAATSVAADSAPSSTASPVADDSSSAGAADDGGSEDSVSTEGADGVSSEAEAENSSSSASGGQWKRGVRLTREVAQSVLNGMMPCDNRDLLYRGHVDGPYVTRDETGKLVVKIVDGSEVRDTSEVCVFLPQDAVSKATSGYQAGDEISRSVVPDDPKWRFLGNPGAIVWTAPQTNMDDGAPVWAGIGAFDPTHEYTVPSDIDRGLVQIQLARVVTPGNKTLTPQDNGGAEQVNIYTTNLGEPTRVLSTNMGEWTYNSAVGSHAHLNWSFSAPGYWKLYWKATVTVNGVAETSEEFEQIWAVGSYKNLMLVPDDNTRVQKVQRSTEDLRAAAGLSAPDNDGFDYHGEGASSSAATYDPGEDCDNLVAPTEVSPVAATQLTNPDNLNTYLDSELEWSGKEVVSADQYQMNFFLDSADSWEVRDRILTNLTTTDQLSQVMAPLPEDAWADVKVANTVRGNEDKVIAVPDTQLRTYTAGTFAKGLNFSDEIKNDTVWAWDQREIDADADNAAGLKTPFSISLPNAEKSGVVGADVYLNSEKSSALVDSSKIAFGELITDPDTGADRWQTLADGESSNRATFSLEAGQSKDLSVIFSAPGIAKVSVFVKLKFADGSKEVAPAQPTYTFVVGNQAINQFQAKSFPKLSGNADQEVPVLATDVQSQVSVAAPVWYQNSLAKYEAKVAECAGAKPDGGEVSESADQDESSGSGDDSEGEVSADNQPGSLDSATFGSDGESSGTKPTGADGGTDQGTSGDLNSVVSAPVLGRAPVLTAPILGQGLGGNNNLGSGSQSGGTGQSSKVSGGSNQNGSGSVTTVNSGVTSNNNAVGQVLAAPSLKSATAPTAQSTSAASAGSSSDGASSSSQAEGSRLTTSSSPKDDLHTAAAQPNSTPLESSMWESPWTWVIVIVAALAAVLGLGLLGYALALTNRRKRQAAS